MPVQFTGYLELIQESEWLFFHQSFVISCLFIGISGSSDIYLRMDQVEIFKALSNKTRLQILAWLKEPEINFPGQMEHGGFEDGVCVGQIQLKAGLTQSTVSEYLALLQRAGLVQSTRKGQWTYYKRNEAAFKNLSKLILSKV